MKNKTPHRDSFLSMLNLPFFLMMRVCDQPPPINLLMDPYRNYVLTPMNYLRHPAPIAKLKL
jgi:hypothetical protein